MTKKKTTKKDRQLSTEVDAYAALDEKHRVAVDMRLQNYAYADIAVNRLVKMQEQTVRSWFAKGGICLKAYTELRAIRAGERQERFDEIDSQLQEMAADAIIVLKKSLKKGSEGAAARVLELAGYVPTPAHNPRNDPNRPVFYIPDNGRDAESH